MPLNKTLDHRVPAHRNKRGGEDARKEERKRERRRTGGLRGRIRYIKETKINGGKEVECFARNLQSGFYRGSMRETKIKKANQT